MTPGERALLVRIKILERRIAGGGTGGAPAAHAATHSAGGTDEIDITNLGGYPGGTTTFLRADGTFATPSAGAAGDLLDWQFIRAVSSETVNNSNTIQVDDELILPVGASESWEFEFVVTYTSTTTADFRCGLKFPTGATQIWYHVDGLVVGAANIGGSIGGERKLTAGLVADAVTGADFGGDTSEAVVVLKGFIRNSTNAGSVALWWAQSVATAVNTVRLAGSYVVGRRFA